MLVTRVLPFAAPLASRLATRAAPFSKRLISRDIPLLRVAPSREFSFVPHKAPAAKLALSGTLPLWPFAPARGLAKKVDPKLAKKGPVKKDTQGQKGKKGGKPGPEAAAASPQAPRSTKKPLIDVLRERAAARRDGKADLPETRTLTTLMVQSLLKKGKRETAERLMRSMFKQIVVKTSGVAPMEALHEAIMNVAPLVDVKSKRQGGSRLMLPVQVTPRKSRRMAVKWMMGSSRSPKPYMAAKMTGEVVDVLNGRGNALRKRDDLYKIAQEFRGSERI